MPGATAGVFNQGRSGGFASSFLQSIPTSNVPGVPTWNTPVVGDLVLIGCTSEGNATVHTNAEGMTKLISGTWSLATGAWSVWYKILTAGDIARGSFTISGGALVSTNVYQGFCARFFPLVAGATLTLRSIAGQYNVASTGAQSAPNTLTPNGGDAVVTIFSFYGTGGSGVAGTSPVGTRWLHGNFAAIGTVPAGWGNASTTSTWIYAFTSLFKSGDTIPAFSEIPASNSDSAILSFAVGVDSASPNVLDDLDGEPLGLVKGYTARSGTLNVKEDKTGKPLKGTVTDRDSTNGSQSYGGGVQII